MERLARSERLAGPIAVMPDVHAAGAVCVGTVFVSADAIFPTAVGQDLGCGMCAQAYPLDAGDLPRARLERLLAELGNAIPAGRRSYRRPQELPVHLKEKPLSTHALLHEREGIGRFHFGTLGGGNHFVEIQRALSGQVWMAVHSGSRGIGAAIAGHHAQAAQSRGGTGPLPWLEGDSAAARIFLEDLQWALAYAAANRRRMLDAATAALERLFEVKLGAEGFFDVAHNLISWEVHGGRLLAVHRKGAMPAHAGARGIIPGSMGTASYIVECLGAPESYASCSHGAGRRMSRTEARQRIGVKDLRRQLAHVVYPAHPGIERALVEEAPAAYKDIKEVLREQDDLVRPLLRLEPLAVLKGG
ncbi:MAG: RtcB family protein [Planctomycetes bacterium]|nr:RtcB family protein [Planctomycetota bacterium]